MGSVPYPHPDPSQRGDMLMELSTLPQQLGAATEFQNRTNKRKPNTRSVARDLWVVPCAGRDPPVSSNRLVCSRDVWSMSHMALCPGGPQVPTVVAQVATPVAVLHIRPGLSDSKGAFSHSARTAPVITVFTPVTALKTCHL